MSEDLIRYDTLIENALRDVVKKAISKVIETGLPGEHHFYISFLTDHPGVELPDYLKEKYPDEMTIVLQHQFFGLSPTDEGFAVMLSFNGVKERLVIPYTAITTFADPSVNFALQFQAMPSARMGEDDDDYDEEDASIDNPDMGEKASSDDENATGQVISLDSFRKKSD